MTGKFSARIQADRREKTNHLFPAGVLVGCCRLCTALATEFLKASNPYSQNLAEDVSQQCPAWKSTQFSRRRS